MWVRFWISAERQIHPEAPNAGSLHLCNGGAWRTWQTTISGNDCSTTYQSQLTNTHTETESNEERNLLHCLEMGVFFEIPGTQNSPENFRNELYQRGSNQGFRNPPFRILGLGPLVWRLWAAIFDYRPLVRDLDSKIVDWGSLVQCLCIGMTNMGSLIWVDWLGTSFSYFCGGIVGSKSLAWGCWAGSCRMDDLDWIFGWVL